MTASFFWANAGQGKDPLEAIKLRDDKWAKTRLQEFWAYPPASFALPRRDALIMSGITDDLQRALQSAIDKAGMTEIRVEGLMAIWYVRCKYYAKDITVVSIASLQGYWDLKLNDPDNSSGYKWLRLYTGYTVNGGLSLHALANQLLPLAKGVDSWKLDRAEVTAEEGFLRSLTPPGLVMSEEGKSGRLVGDLAVVLDDAASQATIIRANQYITDTQLQLRTTLGGGFPDVTELFMLDVGRCEMRLGGDRTRGVLLKATGGEDPRLALRRFAGTDAGATSLSRFMTQRPILALTDKGARTAFAPILPRIPSDQNAILPGNSKQYFISVQKKSNTWEFDYEVESKLPGFTNTGDGSVLDLDVSKSWVKASMQISIGFAEFAAGNLTGALTKVPQFTFHTELTQASLAQQAARGGL